VSRYQKELPKKIKERGKDAFLTHDEIVQCIKWKLAVSTYSSYLTSIDIFPPQGVLKWTVSPDDAEFKFEQKKFSVYVPFLLSWEKSCEQVVGNGYYA
jgi:hypothetical protein